jgi:hypothetical protein
LRSAGMFLAVDQEQLMSILRAITPDYVFDGQMFTSLLFTHISINTGEIH